MREIPDDAVDPAAPAGTPPAAAAEFAPMWCAHGVRWEWQAELGGYLPMVIEPDAEHAGDLPVADIRGLPVTCKAEVTGFDPAEFPNAGPAAVRRAYLEVLRERRGER